MSDLLICSGQHKACQGTVGTYILTEEGSKLKCHRKDDHKKDQYRIFNIPEEAIDLKSVLLIERYSVYKILQESERTKKSAYCWGGI